MGSVTLSDVRGIGFDSGGNIWIAEYDAVLHRFDSTGVHTATFNRKGGGPAEFRTVGAFDLDPTTDRIVIRSVDDIIVFGTDFSEIARWRIPRVAQRSLLGISFSYGKDLLLWPLASAIDSIVRGPRTLSWGSGNVVRSTLKGEIVDTIAAITGGWRLREPDNAGRFGTMIPPGTGRPVWATFQDAGYLIGDGHQQYLLVTLSETGDTLRRFSRPVQRVSHQDRGELRLDRGFFTHAVIDHSREELLVCRVAADPNGSRQVDYFRLETGEYIGTLEWPRCPWRISPDGTIFTVAYSPERVPLVVTYRYAEDE